MKALKRSVHSLETEFMLLNCNALLCLWLLLSLQREKERPAVQSTHSRRKRRIFIISYGSFLFISLCLAFSKRDYLFRYFSYYTSIFIIIRMVCEQIFVSSVVNLVNNEGPTQLLDLHKDFGLNVRLIKQFHQNFVTEQRATALIRYKAQ